MGDTTERYGTLSRFFHWFMALGFAWMFLTACARFIDKDAAFTKAVFQYHGQVGFTILWLGVLRILWAISQSKHRPHNNTITKLGHLALYVLMLAVPFIAVLRTIGSGRPFTYWNTIPILSGSDEKIQWMVDLGNSLHGNLGWLLFLLIAGHIVMAIKHRIAGGEEDVMPRMLGR